jgi:hypothetical protein
LKNRLAQCGLSTTRFAHNSEGLAANEIEADSRYSLDDLVLAEFELNDKVIDLENDIAFGPQPL